MVRVFEGCEMKAFEKQLAKQKQYYKNRSNIMKKGWRAALKWVLKMFLRGDSLGSIVAKIKTELGIK